MGRKLRIFLTSGKRFSPERRESRVDGFLAALRQIGPLGRREMANWEKSRKRLHAITGPECSAPWPRERSHRGAQDAYLASELFQSAELLSAPLFASMNHASAPGIAAI